MLYANNEQFQEWLQIVSNNYYYFVDVDSEDPQKVRFNPHTMYTLYCDAMLDKEFSDDLECQFENDLETGFMF